MISLTCVLLGHDDLISRRDLCLICQRCGRVSRGWRWEEAREKPKLEVRWARADGRERVETQS